MTASSALLLRSADVVAPTRHEPADSLDYFPTPPWATRALFRHILGTKGFGGMTVEEPACGEGHMTYALDDYFGTVRGSDIHDYGIGAEVRDFLDPAAFADVPRPDWIFTNPPFGLDRPALFMSRAIERAKVGVAFFVRTQALEGVKRNAIYRSHRPAIVAQFVERVPLHRGRWEPDGDTKSAYCWIVWRLDQDVRRTDLEWIPPSRTSLLYQRDRDHFASERESSIDV